MSTPAKKTTPAKATPTLAEMLDKDSPDGKDENSPLVDAPPVEDSEKKDEIDREEKDNESEPFYSPEVVHYESSKTPAELAAETPDETAARYNINNTITDEDADNPRVQVYRDTPMNQVPSGTHLHPDIAKDLLNRGISERTTDSAQVKRTITETYDFAPDAEYNDKF